MLNIMQITLGLVLICGATLNAATSQLVNIQAISKSVYMQAYKDTKHDIKKIYKITDIKMAKKMLLGMVEFGIPKNMEYIPPDPQKMILKISTKSGKLLAKGNKNDSIWFIAYYPNENYLSVEGDYPADYGFNLNSGSLEMGNPENTYLSPNGQYLITGAYNGEECYDNKLMIKQNNQYKTVYHFDDKACYFTDKFWKDDKSFYFSVKLEEEKGISWKYYHMSIN